jgi:DNA-directed RNA polymerase specialized sigma24 family protein
MPAITLRVLRCRFPPMNQGPTKEAFDKLLRWLDPDRDKAGEKYERIRFRLIRILAAKGCAEPEDLADKTINVVAGKIDSLLQSYVGDPALYFYAVAKKIFLEQLKKKPLPNAPPPDPNPTELEHVCGLLDLCLEELPAVDKDTTLRYQEGEKGERIKNRKRLAEELGISLNALRIKVFHIHARLRQCMELRLQQLPIGETIWPRNPYFSEGSSRRPESIPNGA